MPKNIPISISILHEIEYSLYTIKNSKNIRAYSEKSNKRDKRAIKGLNN